MTKQDSLLVVYQATSPEMGEIYWPGRIDKRNQEVVDLPLLCLVHILSTFFGWSQIFSGCLVMFWMNYGSNCSHNPFFIGTFLGWAALTQSKMLEQRSMERLISFYWDSEISGQLAAWPIAGAERSRGNLIKVDAVCNFSLSLSGLIRKLSRDIKGKNKERNCGNLLSGPKLTSSRLLFSGILVHTNS